LTDYLLATTPTGGTSDYGVEINGEEVASGSLDEANPTLNLTIPLARLAPGENQVRLRQAGGSPLYFKVSQDFSVGQRALEAAGNISIERRYEDAATGEQVESLTAGQLVKVVVTVEMPSPGAYMLVEDSVPGGLEALNESLKMSSYHATALEAPVLDGPAPVEGGYNYKEIYRDRVRFFISELGAATHTFAYLARATHAGRFEALPTEVWAMYNSQLWGRSASQEVVVAE
jgi:uncharacterized protein YfaS (alpha-2-macroglobulin family)